MTNTKQKLGPKQKRWIADMKSGKYPKGDGALSPVKAGMRRYCCLGVACEGFGMKSKETTFEGLNAFLYSDGMIELPESIRKKLRLRSKSGQVLMDNGSVDRDFLSLSDANDEDMADNFNSVIRLLENNPERYFEGPA